MAGEKQFENKIKKYLEELNNCYFFKYWAGPMSKAGIPDIIACISGKFVGIEVKDVKGRPSPLQIFNCNKINKSGGLATIVYPKDWDNFKTILDQLNNGNFQSADKTFRKYFQERLDK